MGKIFKLLLPLLLFVPIFFQTPNHADWGSDYAHYLHQAKNITLGISQLDNGFIINNNCSEISPQAYGTGFPLILSAVYYLKGFDIASFITLQTVLLSFIGLVMYFFLLKKHNWILAILGASIFVYAPYTIWYRNQILSEYSYLLLQMLFLLIYFYDKKKYRWIYLGLILGFSWSIRSAAVGIILGICCYEFFKFIRLRKSSHARAYLNKAIKYNSLILLVGFGVYKALNRLIFNTGDNFVFHLNIYQNKFKLSTLTENFKYYSYELYQSYFYFWQVEWIGLVCGVAFLILFIKGLSEFKLKGKLILWIIGIQLVMVLAFPFQQGTRYLLPIIPLIIFVIINSINERIRNNVKIKFLLMGVLGLFFYSNFKGISQINAVAGNDPTWSPSTKATLEGWDFINENIPDTSIFVTAFPRVLTFYTNKKAYNPCVLDNDGIWIDIYEKGATHIITNKQTNPWVPTLDAFILDSQPQLDTLFSNSEVVIFKIKS